MKKIISNILICSVMFLSYGCSKNNEKKPEISVPFTTTIGTTTTQELTNETTSSFIAKDEVQSLNNQYSDILFDEKNFNLSDYRDSDLFTPYESVAKSFADIGPVPIEAQLEFLTDVIARVKVVNNNGGFNFNARWRVAGPEDAVTVWSSVEVEFTDVYYGDEVKNNIVEIIHEGGVFENQLYNYAQFTEEMEVGAEYLVFLKNFIAPGESLNGKENNKYSIQTLDGFIKIKDGKSSISNKKIDIANFRSNVDINKIIDYSSKMIKILKNK